MKARAIIYDLTKNEKEIKDVPLERLEDVVHFVIADSTVILRGIDPDELKPLFKSGSFAVKRNSTHVTMIREDNRVLADVRWINGNGMRRHLRYEIFLS